MELNAEKLMDEVFADIEGMIDRGVQWQAEPSHPLSSAKSANLLETEAIEPEQQRLEINLTQDLSESTTAALAVLPKLSPRQLIPDALGDANELDDKTDDKLIADLANLEPTELEQSGSFDKLLISVILATLLITGGAWLFLRDRLPKNPVPVGLAPAADPAPPQDRDFLTYVQRSLERIERAGKPPESVASSNTNQPPTVLERVYIPIYQPSPGASNPSTLPPPQVTTAPIAPTAPPQVAVAPSVAPPVAPSAAPAPPAIQNIAPDPTHVLIGLLELGDRSAALFEIDGTPQRIQVGERIGASGWTLVSINDQEALIRRNGEVRSVYIGQQF
ncbi:MAG: hypothetical protein Kow00121_49330 [Elainellaceae cyanobacterium]